LQLVTFLLSVCHVLIVTDDRALDVDLAELLHQAMHVRPKVSARVHCTQRSTQVHVRLSSDATTSSMTHSSQLPPTVVFVQQRCQLPLDYRRPTIVKNARHAELLLHKAGATNGKSECTCDAEHD